MKSKTRAKCRGKRIKANLSKMTPKNSYSAPLGSMQPMWPPFIAYGAWKPTRSLAGASFINSQAIDRDLCHIIYKGKCASSHLDKYVVSSC